MTYQAYLVLRTAFVVAPVLFGLDKFANLMVQWDRYLAPALAGCSQCRLIRRCTWSA